MITSKKKKKTPKPKAKDKCKSRVHTAVLGMHSVSKSGIFVNELTKQYKSLQLKKKREREK